MKNLFTISLLILSTQFAYSQKEGTIKYSETVQLDFELPEGMKMPDGMSNTINTNKELFFKGNVSVYQDSKDNENTDLEMGSDDGSFQIKIKRDDTEEIYYTDLKEKILVHQRGFMGKEFLIEQNLEKPAWKINDDRIKYLGYVCQKATTTEKGHKPNKNGIVEDRQVVAWFTSEIPVSIGPDAYNQLPGAVLMISIDEGKTEIKATEIILAAPESNKITRPKKGQKVTPEEFDKIVEEKTMEMEKMSGGRRIMIKG